MLDAGAGEFPFRGRPYARDRDTLAAIRAALREAVGRTRADNVGFVLRWHPGGTIGLALDVPRRAPALLGLPALVAAYPPGCWGERERAAPSGPAAARRRYGRLPRGATLPGLPEGPDRPWTTGAALTLGARRESPSVTWSLSPRDRTARVASVPPEVEQRDVPVGARLEPLTAYEREDRERRARHDRGVAWSARVTVTASGPDAGRAVSDIERWLRRAVDAHGAGPLGFAGPLRAFGSGEPSFAMTDDEVAGLFPEPGEPVVPSAHEVRTGIPVGRTAGGSIVSIATPTLEGRHLLVLGETGMGKSSTLAAFVLAAARHHGVVLFDPLGETARTIAARAPARVRSRLLLSFPTEHPMELNALAGSVGLPRDSDALERRLLDLVAGLRRVRSFRYPETSFWGPRIEEVLRRALGVVAARPGATLIDARQILDRPSGRGDAAIRGGTDEEDDLLRLARSRPEEVDGARRLLAEISDSPTLRRLLCATEPSSDADALVAPGCVALLSGDAGAVGETVARYLLAVQLSLVWGRLVARPPGRKVFVVLDEAQWYAHEAVAEMLRLARRSNVHLVVATQALGALSPALQEALLANCADYLLFRGSPDDARTFGRWRPDLPSEAFLGLDRGEAWLLRGKGHDAERIRTAQPGPSVEPPRESEPEVGTRHGSSPSESPPDAVAEHLERLCRASRDPEVHVPLAPLREGDAPAGASMRRWGRALAAAGALRASLGSGADRYWVLDRERTLDLLATPRRTAPTAEAGEHRAPYRPNV